MREIKLRAWNGEEMIYDWFKTVYNPPSKCMDVDMPENYTWACNNSSARAVMQYTGLKDKNGKEIYEGDILQGYKSQQQDESNSWEVRNDVTYRFGSFKCFGERLDEIGNHNGDCFMVWRESGNFLNREGFYYQIRGIEVIGNIHETPELLTNKG